MIKYNRPIILAIEGFVVDALVPVWPELILDSVKVGHDILPHCLLVKVGEVDVGNLAKVTEDCTVSLEKERWKLCPAMNE